MKNRVGNVRFELQTVVTRLNQSDRHWSDPKSNLSEFTGIAERRYRFRRRLTTDRSG